MQIFLILVLNDGVITLWESCFLMAWYVLYVIVVVVGRKINKRLKRYYKEREARMAAEKPHPTSLNQDTRKDPRRRPPMGARPLTAGARWRGCARAGRRPCSRAPPSRRGGNVALQWWR